MKKRHMFFIVLCLLYIGCQEKANTLNSISSFNDSYKDSTLDLMLRKFSLPYPEGFKTDSNSLIFYSTKTFDTSYLIYLKRSNGKINGVYYEVLPTYHNNVNDFAIPESELLYFEGYSFILDSVKWGLIKNEAEKTIVNNINLKNNQGCRDCEEYVLYYNLKSSKSNIDNNFRYESFNKFLKDSFLENIIQKRKPIMHKIK